jgi:hypothetical protein
MSETDESSGEIHPSLTVLVLLLVRASILFHTHTHKHDGLFFAVQRSQPFLSFFLVGESEVERLRRQYRIAEGDRKAYTDESQNTMRKQVATDCVLS